MTESVSPSEKRSDFLIEVYRQMMADINRHIVVVWQSIGVVVGSLAVFGLVEKKVLSLDLAASLLLLVCAWSLALLVDSGYWYNRNLCIIANIERLFLQKDDLRNVHYYFGRHRPKNKMITTLKVQVWLAVGVAAIILVYHFVERVLPGLCLPYSAFNPVLAIPYAVAGLSALFLAYLYKKRQQDYTEFLTNSPGIPIDTSGINYGGGHGFS